MAKIKLSEVIKIEAIAIELFIFKQPTINYHYKITKKVKICKEGIIQ